MKKGFILITVLAVLIMIALGSAAILQSMGSLTTLKQNSIQDVKAQYLAEAGVQRALWVCRTTGCADESYTIDGQTVTIDVTDITVTEPQFRINVEVSYANA